ncbi:MAG: hypothetical protein AB7F78_09145 [Hyphomicrobiaceae bacterium]
MTYTAPKPASAAAAAVTTNATRDGPDGTCGLDFLTGFTPITP